MEDKPKQVLRKRVEICKQKQQKLIWECDTSCQLQFGLITWDQKLQVCPVKTNEPTVEQSEQTGEETVKAKMTQLMTHLCIKKSLFLIQIEFKNGSTNYIYSLYLSTVLFILHCIYLITNTVL